MLYVNDMVHTNVSIRKAMASCPGKILTFESLSWLKMHFKFCDVMCL